MNGTVKTEPTAAKFVDAGDTLLLDSGETVRISSVTGHRNFSGPVTLEGFGRTFHRIVVGRDAELNVESRWDR